MMVWKLAYCQPILTAIVCLAAGTSGGYVPGACSNARVLECLAPLNDVEYNVGQAVVPYMDETTLRDHCNRYNKFETCMENVRPSCTLTERLVYQGIEDAYTFLCEDGFKAYLTHRKCFANPNVHQEGDSCNSTFIQRLNQIKTSPRDVDYKRERICQYVKQYLDCVENILESFCTKEAAKWQRTLDEKSMSPLLNGLDCTLDGSTRNTTTHWVPITIGIVLVISVLIIIMSIVLICMQKRKRRLQAANLQVIGAPPPYDPGPYVVYDGQGVAVTGGGQGMAMANGVQQPANVDGGALPQKTHPDSAHPPPYYQNPERQAAQAQSSTTNDNTTASASGYFGAAASVSAPRQDQKALEAGEAEMGNLDLSEKETIALPQYEQLSAVNDAFGDPEYEEVTPPIPRPDDGYSNPGYSM